MAQGGMCEKMKFTYTYRSSDGERHTAEIEAESRDAAFAKIRTELGIKPIKVVAEVDGSGKSAASPNSASPRGSGALAASFKKRNLLVAAAVVLFAAVLGGVAWWMRSPNNESPATNRELPAANSDQPITVSTPQGPVTLSVATPLPRQAIPGDRRKIEEAVAQERDPPVFRFAAERWLVRYAEPGRQLPVTLETPPASLAPVEATGVSLPRKSATPRGSGVSSNVGTPRGSGALAVSSSVGTPRGSGALAASHAARPLPADFEAALREPIRIASTDFTEVVDLKRIVTGMKREMRAYLAGGGTVEGYLAELEKRQKLEVSYRERAEQKLNDMLNGQDARSPSGRDSLKAAYAYWLKANAQLQAMGIYPLALPDALRSYQMSLDIDE